MINDEREDSFFRHYKEFMQKEEGMSDEEFLDHIEKPEFSQAICYFVIDIVESDLYKELFGEATKASLVKDDKYGYHELSYVIENEVAGNSHDIDVNMSHFYEFSEYMEDDPVVTDIGDFHDVEIKLDTKEDKEAFKIYQDLIEANKNNQYVKTFREIKTVEDISEKSEFKVYKQNNNPFEGLGIYSGCIGLNYMDTTRPYLGKSDGEHKAVAYESPIGPLAYLHFKSSLRDDDPENTYFLSSIGVVPALREKGISKKLYELADKELDFNEETLIYRTIPGRLAPKEFTDSIPSIVDGHKALYLHNKLSEINFNLIEGFSSLSRKEQVSELRELNNKFIEEMKKPSDENMYSKESSIKHKLFVEFKEKIENNQNHKEKKEQKPYTKNTMSP